MGTPMATTTITKKTASLKLAVFFSGPGELATIIAIREAGIYLVWRQANTHLLIMTIIWYLHHLNEYKSNK